MRSAIIARRDSVASSARSSYSVAFPSPRCAYCSRRRTGSTMPSPRLPSPVASFHPISRRSWYPRFHSGRRTSIDACSTPESSNACVRGVGSRLAQLVTDTSGRAFRSRPARCARLSRFGGRHQTHRPPPTPRRARRRGPTRSRRRRIARRLRRARRPPPATSCSDPRHRPRRRARRRRRPAARRSLAADAGRLAARTTPPIPMPAARRRISRRGARAAHRLRQCWR